MDYFVFVFRKKNVNYLPINDMTAFPTPIWVVMALFPSPISSKKSLYRKPTDDKGAIVTIYKQ